MRLPEVMGTVCFVMIWWFVFGGVGCPSLRKVRAGSRSSQPVLLNTLFLLKADSNITLDSIHLLLYM